MKKKTLKIQWTRTFIWLAVFNIVFIPLLYLFEIMELVHWFSGSILTLLFYEDNPLIAGIWSTLFYNILIFALANKKLPIMKKSLMYIGAIAVLSLFATLIWIFTNLSIE